MERHKINIIIEQFSCLILTRVLGKDTSWLLFLERYQTNWRTAIGEEFGFTEDIAFILWACLEVLHEQKCVLFEFLATVLQQ